MNMPNAPDSTPLDPQNLIQRPRELLRLLRAASARQDETRNALCEWFTELVTPLLRKQPGRPWFQPADALDALQDILLVLVRVTPRYDPKKGDPKAFFAKVAKRKLLTWLKKRARQWKRDITGTDERLDTIPAQQYEAPDVAEHLRLESAVEQLPELYRIALRLELIGMRQRTIARVPGCDNKCVRKRLARAKERLRPLLMTR